MKPSSLVLAVCAFLITASLPAEAGTDFALVKEWNVSLGPVGEGHSFFRGAVCPDGTYYLSDGQGSVARLRADGSAGGNLHLDGFNALALTCDTEGRLIALPAKRMLIIGPDANGSLSVLQSVPLAGEIRSAFAVAPDGAGGFIVLGLKGQAGYLQHVNERGEVLASQEIPGKAPWSASTVLNGTVTTDRESSRTIYIPENPYTFIEYDPQSGIIRTTPRNDPTFQAPSGNAGTPVPRGDRVLRGVFLPGGEILVQVVKRSVALSAQDHANIVHTSSYLELFDRSLNLKATIPVNGFGQLQGASQDGSLRFNLISPQDGIRVIRARLSVP